jgi:hypothetical protein
VNALVSLDAISLAETLVMSPRRFCLFIFMIFCITLDIFYCSTMLLSIDYFAWGSAIIYMIIWYRSLSQLRSDIYIFLFILFWKKEYAAWRSTCFLGLVFWKQRCISGECSRVPWCYLASRNAWKAGDTEDLTSCTSFRKAPDFMHLLPQWNPAMLTTRHGEWHLVGTLQCLDKTQ